jgi:hypothetical protein
MNLYLVEPKSGGTGKGKVEGPGAGSSVNDMGG